MGLSGRFKDWIGIAWIEWNVEHVVFLECLTKVAHHAPSCQALFNQFILSIVLVWLIMADRCFCMYAHRRIVMPCSALINYTNPVQPCYNSRRMIDNGYYMIDMAKHGQFFIPPEGDFTR